MINPGVYPDPVRGHILIADDEGSEATYTDLSDGQLLYWGGVLHLTPDLASALGRALIAWAERDLTRQPARQLLEAHDRVETVHVQEALL